MDKSIYLDNQTATFAHSSAIEKSHISQKELWASPYAPHLPGQMVLSQARRSLSALYRLVGARDEDHFIFASSSFDAVERLFGGVYLDVVRVTGRT
ncbi:MAG: hypothetical protein ACM3JI_03390, partial [Anaerolineae bacterium]